MRKRAVSLALCLCMVLSLLPLPALAVGKHPFTDVAATDWFNDSVIYVYERNLMKGTSDITFEPYKATQRGMIVTILHRLEGTPTVTSGNPFVDVPRGSNYENAIIWAAANGIANGYDNATFGPYDNITRQQMAAILYRYAQMKGYRTSTSANLGEYADSIQIGDYARTAMAWANGEGLINGNSSKQLMPTGNATRAHTAAILTRFCQNVVLQQTPPVSPPIEEPEKTIQTTPEPVTPANYTVTFDLNYDDAGVYQTVSVKAGEKVTTPTKPKRDGYHFLGWYTAATKGTKFNFNKVINAVTTLYARWSKISSSNGSSGGSYTSISTYTVTFYMNDGTNAVHTTATVSAGNSISAPIQPTREGFSFNGWYTDVTATTAYNFGTAVTGNFSLYAKWLDSATAYYMNHADLLEVVKVDESDDVMNEMDVKAFLDSRGFGDTAISYRYSIAGSMLDEDAIVEESENLHPMYRTIYMSESEETWMVYVINGSIFAYPFSFALESDLGVDLIFSESNMLTSYDDATNQFFVTVPHASEMIVKTVETINAETLNGLTIEEICRLSGATVPALTSGADYSSDSAAMLSIDDPYVSEVASLGAAYSSDDPFIVVSLGDSYSSGEGIEYPEEVAHFYGQNKPLRDRVHDYDWLAHRSELSWPGQLNVPGTDGNFVGPRIPLSYYKVPFGERGSGNIQWYFTAVSGAKTINFGYDATDDYTIEEKLENPGGKQKKDYKKWENGLFSAKYESTEWHPNQMDVFNYIDDLNDVDYVTLTIGGNDVDFAGVIALCFEPTYLEYAFMDSAYENVGLVYEGSGNALLENKLNGLWDNIDSTMAKIKGVYEKIHAKVPNAAIIVAGYPQLLDKDGRGTVISLNEATLVNEKVHAFNEKIRELVESCESGLNTYFVDVETEFNSGGGHQAYSRENWINPIWLKSRAEDLDDGIMNSGLKVPPGSAYSMHPNLQGAQAYARCVNDKIAWLESNRRTARRSNIVGGITIADTDTDMTNNLPLQGALITIRNASVTGVTTTSDEHGQYSLQNIPAGRYSLTVTKDGYIPVTEVIEVPEDGSEVIYNVVIEAISEGYNGIGYASGTVYDVGTGIGVSGLTLNMYRGLETSTGDIVLTTQTTESGRYTTLEGLEAGNYTVVVIDERIGISSEERYTTNTFNIKVLGGITIDSQNGYVSNGVTSDNIRIVLTWGATPSDLDSHLVGPTSRGDRFHVYYSDKTYGSEVDLDVDDTSSYGPETVTIRSINEGVYTYAVHDFSNGGSSNSMSLSTSGAQVRVYRGGAEPIMTYNVPTGRGGTLWTVFSYDSNTQSFTTINDMSYNGPHSGVLQSAYDEVPSKSDENSEYEAVNIDLDMILSDIGTNDK